MISDLGKGTDGSEGGGYLQVAMACLQFTKFGVSGIFDAGCAEVAGSFVAKLSDHTIFSNSSQYNAEWLYIPVRVHRT